MFQLPQDALQESPDDWHFSVERNDRVISIKALMRPTSAAADGRHAPPEGMLRDN
jgi:hypothetical protein